MTAPGNGSERPQQVVTSIDPAKNEARLASGETLSYDLFIGIPVHRAPDPLRASGLTVNGWVPVDQTNLRTRYAGVYAIGDVVGDYLANEVCPRRRLVLHRADATD